MSSSIYDIAILTTHLNLFFPQGKVPLPLLKFDHKNELFIIFFQGTVTLNP